MQATTQVAQATVLYREKVNEPALDLTALAISNNKRADPVYDAALQLFESKLEAAEHRPDALVKDETDTIIAVKTCRGGRPCGSSNCSDITTIYKPTRR